VSAPTLREIRELGQKGANEPSALARVYGSRLSRYFTYVLARTPIGPDGVTVLGIGAGIAAGALLLLPLGPIHLLAVVLYQASYVLDFSDGEIARIRGISSQAGAYLDWLGHFYVPTFGAALLGIQVADVAGRPWLVLGAVATIGLAAFHWSCREHIVIAHLRRHPEDVSTRAVQNALLDHPDERVDDGRGAGRVVPRRRNPILVALGAVLFFPGAMHMLSLALLADLALGGLGAGPTAIAREALLAAWAIGFVGHGLLAVRRNYRVLRHLDGLRGGELPWAAPEATSGSETRST
jgi:hypothetical protein